MNAAQERFCCWFLWRMIRQALDAVQFTDIFLVVVANLCLFFKVEWDWTWLGTFQRISNYATKLRIKFEFRMINGECKNEHFTRYLRKFSISGSIQLGKCVWLFRVTICIRRNKFLPFIWVLCDFWVSHKREKKKSQHEISKTTPNLINNAGQYFNKKNCTEKLWITQF